MVDGMLYAKAAAALLFVLALLGAFAFVARRLSGGAIVLSKRQKRLAIVEVAAIDPKRRLVLVRRDQTEHLLLIGGGSDLVVEGGIEPGGMVARRIEAPVADPEPVPRRSRLDEVRF